MKTALGTALGTWARGILGGGTEFKSQAALASYLRRHPAADASKHSVTKSAPAPAQGDRPTVKKADAKLAAASATNAINLATTPQEKKAAHEKAAAAHTEAARHPENLPHEKAHHESMAAMHASRASASVPASPSPAKSSVKLDHRTYEVEHERPGLSHVYSSGGEYGRERHGSIEKGKFKHAYGGPSTSDAHADKLVEHVKKTSTGH